ncbi:hypothetical protein KCU86_g4386, partial [Aureobasidium melanogenum]
MIIGTAAPIPTPIPMPVQSRLGSEELDCVVVGLATTIEGMLAVSTSVLVPECPMVEPDMEDEEVDSTLDDDDELDIDEPEELEEADDA